MAGDDEKIVLDRRAVENLRRAHIQGIHACDKVLGWETRVERIRPSDGQKNKRDAEEE